MFASLRRNGNHFRLIAVVIVAMASLMLAQGGYARAQASGNQASIEMQLAPFLAMGGSLADLCATDTHHEPGCDSCDTCCLHVPTAVQSAPGFGHGARAAVIRATRPGAQGPAIRPRAPPVPPARGPPALI